MSAAPAITPERVLELKVEATSLKKAAGINHTAALARIAHREGYSSWEVLVCAAGGSDTVKEAHRDQKWANPTEAQVNRALRKADRHRRYGSAA